MNLLFILLLFFVFAATMADKSSKVSDTKRYVTPASLPGSKIKHFYYGPTPKPYIHMA